MKGITHFITGVAIATFFPEVVHQAVAGSLLPVLGGIGGILPDTLDFKFARYFERYDLEIDPGPDPDPQAIADDLVSAMQTAYETDRPQHVMVHTIRLGSDLWREYGIRFDPEARQVGVRIGPVVNTGQVPLPGSEPEGARAGQRRLDLPLVQTYSDEYRVNIFSGPSFRFEREGDQLYVHFLDWHRRWSHSLVLAVAVGAVAALLVGLAVDWHTAPWAGLVTGLGFAGHILEDQLGYMGSNLLWPLTKKRTTGLKLIHSGDAIPNLLTVWTAVALILFNLDRFSAAPRLNPTVFLLTAVVLPLLALLGIYVWGQKDRPQPQPPSLEAQRQADIIAEAQEIEIA